MGPCLCGRPRALVHSRVCLSASPRPPAALSEGGHSLATAHLDVHTRQVPRTDCSRSLVSREGSCRTLVAGGAAIDATDKFGSTAMHYAARGGHLSIVQLLVAAGGTPNITNKNGNGCSGLTHCDQGRLGPRGLPISPPISTPFHPTGKTAWDMARGHSTVVTFLEMLQKAEDSKASLNSDEAHQLRVQAAAIKLQARAQIFSLPALVCRSALVTLRHVRGVCARRGSLSCPHTYRCIRALFSPCGVCALYACGVGARAWPDVA